MRLRVSGLVLSAVAACSGCRSPSSPPAPANPAAPPALKSPQDFAATSDNQIRSIALFVEATKVLRSPRCLNCHPAGDSPLQGDDNRVHDPPVFRGPDDRGVVGLECTSCHQDHNLAHARIPGAPQWHLAPRAMAWEGKSDHQICEQMKDPKRNGGKSLAQLIEHNAHDELVGWGWSPGADRTPSPGTQAQFGALIAEWVQSGAVCPPEAKP